MSASMSRTVRSRKTAWVGIVVALALALPSNAPARPRSARGQEPIRTQQQEYFAGGISGQLGVSAAGQVNIGAVRFDAGRARFVDVEITDSAGENVYAEVTQFTAGGDRPDVFHAFCSATTRPVSITPGYEVQIYLYEGTCEDGSPSLATQGTVTARFTRHRAKGR